MSLRRAKASQSEQISTRNGIQDAHLCPSDVRRNKELDVSVTENTQHRAPKVPVGETAPSFEQLRGRLLLARLVFGPREIAVSTRLVLLVVALHVSEAFVRGEAGEDEDGLDAQFFERSEVALDAGGQRERQSAGSGQERLPRCRTVEEGLEVVGGINAQAGIGEDVERKSLEVLPLLKVSW
jgi:hypothetical protein